MLSLDPIQRIKYFLTEEVFVNSYVISGKTFSILIDSGVSLMRNQYLQLIENLNMKSQPLKLLINTHAHHDHMGCNSIIQDATGCLIIALTGSQKWIEDINLNYEEFALAYPELHPDSDSKREDIFHSMVGNSKVNLLAQEGDTIRIDDLELKVIELPGHIEYELGLIESKTKTLILGDIIVRTDIPIFPGHLRPSQLRRSLKKIEILLETYAIQRVLTGHFNPMSKEETINEVHKVYYYLSTIDEIIINTLKGQNETNLATLWTNVCEGMNKEQEFRSISMVYHHLLDLEEAGFIKKIDKNNEVFWRKNDND